MRISIKLIRSLPRLSPILLAAIAIFCSIGKASAFERPTGAIAPNAQVVGKHMPLTVVGISIGQTARISARHWVNPDNTFPPDPCMVELEFHDATGRLLFDRSGRPFHRTVSINPGRGAFLDLNG